METKSNWLRKSGRVAVLIAVSTIAALLVSMLLGAWLVEAMAFSER